MMCSNARFASWFQSVDEVRMHLYVQTMVEAANPAGDHASEVLLLAWQVHLKSVLGIKSKAPSSAQRRMYLEIGR